MNRLLRDGIAATILQAESAARNPDSYAYLPEIIESLRSMLDGDTMSQRDRERLAGGLGRLVTDDFAFSESHLGTKLLELADQFASSEG